MALQVIIMCCSKLLGRLRDDQGFTLGEMVATLALFSILAAVAVPNYLAFQPGQRLNGGAREVLGKLRWARAQAVEENATYIVSFLDSHTLRIFNDSDLDGTWDTGEWKDDIDLQLNYSDVEFTVTGNDPKFTGRGTVSTGTTTITLTNSSGSKQVQVTPTGNVKIN